MPRTKLKAAHAEGWLMQHPSPSIPSPLPSSNREAVKLFIPQPGHRPIPANDLTRSLLRSVLGKRLCSQ